MSAQGMSTRRLWVVQTLILAMLGGSLYCIAVDREYWPFSNYPMYSELERPGPWSQLRLVGVAGGEEVGLRASGLLPFDWIRLRRAFSRLNGRPDRQVALERALADCLARYTARRIAGLHRGRRLEGLQLYRVEWDQVDPRHPASAERVSRRVLLAQVSR